MLGDISYTKLLLKSEGKERYISQSSQAHSILRGALSF